MDVAQPMQFAPRPGVQPSLPLLAQAAPTLQQYGGGVVSDANYPSPASLVEAYRGPNFVPQPGMNLAPGYQGNEQYVPMRPDLPPQYQRAPQMPQQLPQNPMLQGYQRMMMDQYAANDPAAQPAPPMMPYLGQGNSPRERMMMSAAGNNRMYMDYINKVNAERAQYNQQAMQQYMQNQQAMRQMRGNIARDGYTQAMQAQQHMQQQYDKANENPYAKPEAYAHALDFLAKQFPSPSPERTAYIRDTQINSQNAINLWPYAHTHFQREETMQQNRVLGSAEKMQRMQQRDQLFPYIEQKAKAGAMLAQDRADVYRATKDASIEMAATREMMAQLKLAEEQAYGDEAKRNQIALQRAQLEKVAQEDERQMKKGAHIIVNDYNRMESQRMNALDENDKFNKDDEIRKAYGEREGAITKGEATDRAYAKAGVQLPSGFEQFQPAQKSAFYNSLPPATKSKVASEANKIYHSTGGMPAGVAAAQRALQAGMKPTQQASLEIGLLEPQVKNIEPPTLRAQARRDETLQLPPQKAEYDLPLVKTKEPEKLTASTREPQKLTVGSIPAADLATLPGTVPVRPADRPGVEGQAGPTPDGMWTNPADNSRWVYSPQLGWQPHMVPWRTGQVLPYQLRNEAERKKWDAWVRSQEKPKTAAQAAPAKPSFVID
jgi:hypothetical protein